MKVPPFDIDLDKHYNATVVIACQQCGHETRQHLDSLAPDATLNCPCGTDISLRAAGLQAARQQADRIKTAYRVS